MPHCSAAIDELDNEQVGQRRSNRNAFNLRLGKFGIEERTRGSPRNGPADDDKGDDTDIKFAKAIGRSGLTVLEIDGNREARNRRRQRARDRPTWPAETPSDRAHFAQSHIRLPT